MKEPRFLSLEDVLKIHQNQLFQHGGIDGIRSTELLQSAIAQPFASVGGEFLHATIFEMAAAYLFHICQNHPFLDGNKRSALQACDVFLFLNGYDLVADEDEVAQMVLSIANDGLKKAEIAVFIEKNAVKV